MTDVSAQGPPSDASGRPRLVVGIDGSEHSRSALAWALAEATRRSATVDVVTTFQVDFYWSEAYPLDAERIDSVRAETEARSRAFLDEVRAAPEVAGVPGATDVPVTVHVLDGAPAEQLVHRSAAADLLVVGSRGRGAVRSTVLGSVALHCSVHAHCPVVVVRPGQRAVDGPVVVGVDDSPAGRTALHHAAGEARRRDRRLDVVVARVPADTWSELSAMSGPSAEELCADAVRSGQRLVDEVLGGAPDVDVRVVADVGPADRVLVQQAEGASLLVVGSRSRSRLAGMVLGSVALRTVVHAPCPIMVVHPPRTGTPGRPAVAAAAPQG
ncbi:universal stress protein [Blastococcus sp. VKM Ac-2987]|uniref:universal stress protein n=1 Tax=Blastococcus sp. VKM Ac-2987 TaxID=3004141 RepID=UPI0022AB7A8C|nr:universal stress protein [Blastococcus sp. VKM Ac-2987]MCZ2860601.1 universal stress protein [Blastococcus sp. VKM Ac-2987]